MAFSKPTVTIDLDEYNYLLKQKEVPELTPQELGRCIALLMATHAESSQFNLERTIALFNRKGYGFNCERTDTEFGRGIKFIKK